MPQPVIKAREAVTRKSMRPLRIELYTPHKGQVALHASSARFRVATCGRRWGKTLGCVNEIVKHALELPKSLNWWVAPVYKQSSIAYRMIVEHFADVISHKDRTGMVIEFKNKSRIEFKSADNFDALRGEGVHFLIIDEAAMVAREAWEAALRPTLSDTLGKAILVSTPKGRNWFYEAWVRGQDGEHKDWSSFRFPTSSNPYIPAVEIQNAKETLPRDVFTQEYGAEFLEDGAGVFRGIYKCVQGDFEEPIPGHSYIFSWDIAKHNDFSVIMIADAVTGHIVAFDRFNAIDYMDQIPRVSALIHKYWASGIMDSTGVGDPILEQLQRQGISVMGYKFTNSSKQLLIENLVLMIEQQIITYPEIKPLLYELSVFQYMISAAGHFKFSAPEGFHDDCVISLALAAWLLKDLLYSVIKSKKRRLVTTLFD